jgi:hypothetical protein
MVNCANVTALVADSSPPVNGRKSLVLVTPEVGLIADVDVEVEVVAAGVGVGIGVGMGAEVPVGAGTWVTVATGIGVDVRVALTPTAAAEVAAVEVEAKRACTVLVGVLRGLKGKFRSEHPLRNTATVNVSRHVRTT